jgi:hypothetical protein
LVTFLPLELTFDDGSTRRVTLPAELWARNSVTASKLLVSERPIVRIEFDPERATADADRTNNLFPQAIGEERFEVTKERRPRNPMQRARDEERREEGRRIAAELSVLMLDRWRGVPAERWQAPLALAGEITEKARGLELLQAPPGAELTIEFADTVPDGAAPPERVRLATVVLRAKPVEGESERKAEAPPTVRFAVFLDGSVAPVER